MNKFEFTIAKLRMLLEYYNRESISDEEIHEREELESVIELLGNSSS